MLAEGVDFAIELAEPRDCGCRYDLDGLVEVPCETHARNAWRMDDLLRRLLDAELDERIRKHTRPVAVLGQGV